MVNYFKAPSANYINTTLNGSINDSVTTITLTDTSNLQSPGVIVIDRQDGSGNNTPNSREVISYTGISSNDLTGCTRGAENSTARSHSDGALVETMPTVGMWNDLRDGVAQEHNTSGTHAGILPRAASVQVSVKGSDLETGDGKAYLIIPDELNGLDLADISAQVAVAPVGATITVQLYNVTDSVDMLSTALTIDASETTSETAATPAVIDTSNDDVASNDLLRVDVDQVGSTTAGEALVVLLRFS